MKRILNPPTRHPRRALTSLGLSACVLCVASVSVGQTPSKLVMPEGYTLAQLPQPVPSSTSHLQAGRDRMQFSGPHRVVHVLDLDPTPSAWLRELVTVRIGEARPWNPGQNFHLWPWGPPGSPPGSSGSAGSIPAATLPMAVAILDQTTVAFDSAFTTPGHVVESKGMPGHTLHQEDGHFVVTRHNDRRWVFQTTDQGDTWRLVRIDFVQHPGQSLKLVYEGNILQTIQLPGDEQVTFKYESGFVTSISFPLGRQMDLVRDAAGRITRAEISVQVDPANRMRQQKTRFDYEYEATAGTALAASPGAAPGKLPVGLPGAGGDLRYPHRLLAVTDPNRVRWVCEYQDSRITATADAVRTFDARVTNSVDGGVLFQRYVIHPDGRHQRTEGSASRGASIDTAAVAYAFAASVAEQQALRPAAEAAAAVAPGLPVWLRGRLLAYREPWRYNLAALNWRPAAERKSDGEQPTASLEYDSLGRTVRRIEPDKRTTDYIYSPTGDLIEARVQGDIAPHRFVTDKWKRIVKHEMPEGSYRQWDYDTLGRLIRILDGVPLPKKKDDVFAETQYRVTETVLEYDARGNLVRIESANSGRERFNYDPAGRMATHTSSSGQPVRFQYDRMGRVTRIEQADGSREEYAYYPDGRLARQEDRPKGTRWTIREHDPQGRVVAETIENMGRTQYEYDELGRRNRIVQPDGKDIVYTFDDFNRVVKVRGTAQPPVDITYDKDGNRTVTTPQLQEGGRS